MKALICRLCSYVRSRLPTHIGLSPPARRPQPLVTTNHGRHYSRPPPRAPGTGPGGLHVPPARPTRRPPHLPPASPAPSVARCPPKPPSAATRDHAAPMRARTLARRAPAPALRGRCPPARVTLTPLCFRRHLLFPRSPLCRVPCALPARTPSPHRRPLAMLTPAADRRARWPAPAPLCGMCACVGPARYALCPSGSVRCAVRPHPCALPRPWHAGKVRRPLAYTLALCSSGAV
jgi:hypothetical protein